jgi:hypothetical protein
VPSVTAFADRSQETFGVDFGERWASLAREREEMPQLWTYDFRLPLLYLDKRQRFCSAVSASMPETEDSSVLELLPTLALAHCTFTMASGSVA